MNKLTSLFLVIVFLLPLTGQAQFLKKIRRAAQDKIEERIADKVVEEISEELANRAMKPINEAFDEYLKSSYESDTGEKWDQSKFDSLMTAAGSDYTAFIEGMNKSANVPDQYNFDVSLDIETIEESKEKTISQMMFSSVDGSIGFQQTEDGNDMLMVMDPKNDVMVMFNQKKKSAQAMPSAFSITKGLSEAYQIEEDYKLQNFEETGKTKKIAGYNSKGYKGETKTEKFSGYFSTDLPFNWNEVFSELMNTLSPKIYDEYFSKIEGMMMISESYDKETKKTTRWEVLKVSEVTTTISKSDYKFPGIEE